MIDFDVAPLADALCSMLRSVAVPHEDVRPRRHNVEVRIGLEGGQHSGQMLLRFMHRDGILFEVTVDVAECLRNYERYVPGLLRDMDVTWRDAMRTRAQATRIDLSRVN